jgi:hypothetical protein
MKRKIITLKQGINYPTFISETRRIQSNLVSGMFNFLTPTPQDVIQNLDALEALQVQTAGRDFRNVAQRNTLRKTIQGMLSAQVAMLNGFANGDDAILEATGFELNKVREPRPVPTTGSTPDFTVQGDGVVFLECKGIHYHDYVELEIDGPNGLCNHYTGLYTKFKVANLPKGVELKARMRGHNSRGAGEYSSSLTFKVYGGSQHPDAA